MCTNTINMDNFEQFQLLLNGLCNFYKYYLQLLHFTTTFVYFNVKLLNVKLYKLHLNCQIIHVLEVCMHIHVFEVCRPFSQTAAELVEY